MWLSSYHVIVVALELLVGQFLVDYSSQSRVARRLSCQLKNIVVIV